MRARFLLGPAGAGKTFRCLSEIRQALEASPEGPGLLWVAPKQTTYQLERQLLTHPSVRGYTRLHILSFERLAHFVFERLGRRAPELLDEEGRLMVLRGLLAKRRSDLKLFRASARLTGFAQQLSLALRELQRKQLTPAHLLRLAERVGEVEGLSFKLQDLATLLRDYLDWLAAHHLHDADCLLAAATEALIEGAAPKTQSGEPAPGADPPSARPEEPGLGIGAVWVDGFAEFSETELGLLAALLPGCDRATVTFCLDRAPARKESWLSNWSIVRKSFEDCRRVLEPVSGGGIAVEILPRHAGKSRFLNNPVLRHLERAWAAREACPEELAAGDLFAPSLGQALRLAACADPEGEVTLAAREILRYVRGGGRFRDVTVLVRRLEGYHPLLQRIFARYEIPFFLDRRESVSHHPMTELTRSALRTVALGWQHEDWFTALKTGLMPANDDAIDRLENEALAHGWKNDAWHNPVRFRELPPAGEERERMRLLEAEMEQLRQQVIEPFHKLELALQTAQNRPTGPQLAAALRELWEALRVQERLQAWGDSGPAVPPSPEAASMTAGPAGSLHETVWHQMNNWLENLALAFPTEPLALREWLPILEAGLASLTVGVIPPALDQVLIGALDRSRNPDIKLALVLGFNETVFPAPPELNTLLTESDRAELERRNVSLGNTARQQLARERYYAYLACTRARQRLVLTCSLRDLHGAPLNPSPFLGQVRQLFPALDIETVPNAIDWRASEHAVELVGPLLQDPSLGAAIQGLDAPAPGPAADAVAAPAAEGGPARQPSAPAWAEPRHLRSLEQLPGLGRVLEQLRSYRNPAMTEWLAPELATALYGPVLRSSVSRMEQFAACPFKYFVHSGLRAEERRRFELDVKEQGLFQHDVLALFHQELAADRKRWRDITPAQARTRIGRVAAGLVASYRNGLLESTEETRFMARILTGSLQDFAETLVGWMQDQYRFDPVAVELPFGEDDSSPPWRIPLPGGQRIELFGRIDRVDVCRRAGDDTALCVVLDYKSSRKYLDSILMANGLQLQLLTYLNVIRDWPNPQALFGASRLVPAGMFYVSLRGKYEPAKNRREALADPQQARKEAYRHAGRFDADALPQLDARPDATRGDQFSYRLTKSGQTYKSDRDPLPTADFLELLDSVRTNLREMGRQVYAGVAIVAPYRKGKETACEQCEYHAVCRIDPWTHAYRVLRKEDEPPAANADARAPNGDLIKPEGA